MNATIQKQRIIEHGERMKRLFGLPDTVEPYWLCQKLRRIERHAHVIAERACGSCPYSSEAAMDKDLERVQAMLASLLGADNAKRVYINTDPRGYALKLTAEESQLHKGETYIRDWGGYILLAPQID